MKNPPTIFDEAADLEVALGEWFGPSLVMWLQEVLEGGPQPARTLLAMYNNHASNRGLRTILQAVQACNALRDSDMVQESTVHDGTYYELGSDLDAVQVFCELTPSDYGWSP